MRPACGGVAIAPCYHRQDKSSPASWLFWLSPLADPLAVLRLFLSSWQRPTQWRGRIYQLKDAVKSQKFN